MSSDVLRKFITKAFPEGELLLAGRHSQKRLHEHIYTSIHIYINTSIRRIHIRVVLTDVGMELSHGSGASGSEA